MRILYLTRSDSPHDTRFLKAMAASGNEVFCLRLESVNPTPTTPDGVVEIQWEGLHSHFKLTDLVKLVPRLKQVVREYKPDVIHAGPIQDVAFLAAVSGLHPLVSMSWGFDMMRDVDKNWLQRWITAFTLKCSDRFVMDCHAVADRAVSFGYPRERMVIFPWGVDLAHFSRKNGEAQAQAWRKEIGWEDKFVVLGLRSWEPQYGMDLLAEAFVRAAKQNPELRLLLLGNGSQEEKIMRILREGDVIEIVHLGGRIGLDDLPKYYCAADVYITPAHVDGSSVSLLEAMACELPSIASNIPGNCEWIEHGQSGWIFKDGNLEQLVGFIHTSINSQERNAMGLAARKKIEKEANWYANFPKLIAAYESLIGGLDEKE